MQQLDLWIVFFFMDAFLVAIGHHCVHIVSFASQLEKLNMAYKNLFL
jgi:hypothetical protein